MSDRLQIKLVIFDLDETLWTVPESYASDLVPPFRLRGPDSLTDRWGRELTVFPDTRHTIDSLLELGITLSICSRNYEQPTLEILELLELGEHFWNSMIIPADKDLGVSRIIKAATGLEPAIRPHEMLFVDDWPSNIRDVKPLGVRTLLMGTEIRGPSEVLDRLTGWPPPERRQ